MSGLEAGPLLAILCGAVAGGGVFLLFIGIRGMQSDDRTTGIPRCQPLLRCVEIGGAAIVERVSAADLVQGRRRKQVEGLRPKSAMECCVSRFRSTEVVLV